MNPNIKHHSELCSLWINEITRERARECRHTDVARTQTYARAVHQTELSFDSQCTFSVGKNGVNVGP